jgi:hypothetical protein
LNDEYDRTRPFVTNESDADLDWEDEDGSPKLLWGRVLALAGVLLLAFLLGRATAPDDASAELEEVQAQLANARDQIAELEEQATAVPTDSPAPSITTTEDTGDEPTDEPTDDEPDEPEGKIKSYTVQPGDTYNSIAEDEFDTVNPNIVSCLIEANGGEEVLSVGDEINIPETCGEE